MLKKIAFGLFAVCLMTTSSLAQNSDKAKESHDKAIKMINKGKLPEVSGSGSVGLPVGRRV